jgi:hypothetical protein
MYIYVQFNILKIIRIYKIKSALSNKMTSFVKGVTNLAYRGFRAVGNYYSESMSGVKLNNYYETSDENGNDYICVKKPDEGTIQGAFPEQEPGLQSALTSARAASPAMGDLSDQGDDNNNNDDDDDDDDDDFMSIKSPVNAYNDQSSQQNIQSRGSAPSSRAGVQGSAPPTISPPTHKMSGKAASSPAKAAGAASKSAAPYTKPPSPKAASQTQSLVGILIGSTPPASSTSLARGETSGVASDAGTYNENQTGGIVVPKSSTMDDLMSLDLDKFQEFTTNPTADASAPVYVPPGKPLFTEDENELSEDGSEDNAGYDADQVITEHEKQNYKHSQIKRNRVLKEPLYAWAVKSNVVNPLEEEKLTEQMYIASNFHSNRLDDAIVEIGKTMDIGSTQISCVSGNDMQVIAFYGQMLKKYIIENFSDTQPIREFVFSKIVKYFDPWKENAFIHFKNFYDQLNYAFREYRNEFKNRGDDVFSDLETYLNFIQCYEILLAALVEIYANQEKFQISGNAHDFFGKKHNAFAENYEIGKELHGGLVALLYKLLEGMGKDAYNQ